MAGQAAALSATANRELPRHPEPGGRSVHARCGRRTTATPAAALRPAQELRANRRYRPPPEGVRDGSLHSSPVLLLCKSHANRRTARSRSSRVKGFVTYASAPCCWPQNLSLAESFEVTIITGIILNSAFPFRSRQTWKPFRPGITMSSRITLGRSFVMVSSTRLGSCNAIGQYPSLSSKPCISLTSAGESSTIRTFLFTAVLSPCLSTEQRCTLAASLYVPHALVSFQVKCL